MKQADDLRGEAAPQPAPHVRLTGPSGAIWEWNQPQPDNAVLGLAVDFARVVTQVRNVADTALVTTGDAARRWMAVAQCFAGLAVAPPAEQRAGVTACASLSKRVEATIVIPG